MHSENKILIKNTTNTDNFELSLLNARLALQYFKLETNVRTSWYDLVNSQAIRRVVPNSHIRWYITNDMCLRDGLNGPTVNWYMGWWGTVYMGWWGTVPPLNSKNCFFLVSFWCFRHYTLQKGASIYYLSNACSFTRIADLLLIFFSDEVGWSACHARTHAAHTHTHAANTSHTRTHARTHTRTRRTHARRMHGHVARMRWGIWCCNILMLCGFMYIKKKCFCFIGEIPREFPK